MSSATLGSFTILMLGGCGKNANSTFQMFSGQLENQTWIVCLGNIAGLFRREQWEGWWKHSSCAVRCLTEGCWGVKWWHSLFRTPAGHLKYLPTCSPFPLFPSFLQLQLLSEAQDPSDLLQGKCCFVPAVPQSYLSSWRLKKRTVI